MIKHVYLDYMYVGGRYEAIPQIRRPNIDVFQRTTINTYKSYSDTY